MAAVEKLLAPKISLRQLLIGMAVVGFFLALTSLAYRGSNVALGLVVSILSVPALFGIYALVYVVLVQICRYFQRRSKRNFATAPVGESADSNAAVESK